MAFLRFMWKHHRIFSIWAVGWLPFSFWVLPYAPPWLQLSVHMCVLAFAFYGFGLSVERLRRTADAQRYGQTLVEIKGIFEKGLRVEQVQWFGPKPFAPVCKEDNHRETPTGAECFYCEEPILAEESGVLMIHMDGSDGSTRRPWHRECFLRSVSGSVAHLRKRCMCYGGTDPEEPEGMTRREEAALAAKIWSGEN